MSDDTDRRPDGAADTPPRGSVGEEASGATAAARAASRARRIGGPARPRPPAPQAREARQPSGGRHAQEPPEVKETQPAPPSAPQPPAGTPAAPAPDESSVSLTKTDRVGMGARAAARAAARHSAAPGEAPAPAPRPRPRRTARPDLAWLPAIAAGLAAAAVLALCVVFSHGVWWGKSTTESLHAERDQVLAAAKSCIATMNTYDYRKLDQAEQAGLACTTGTLSKQYREVFEKTIKPQAATVQFTQTAQVNKAGVESVSPDGAQWVILVFGQLAVTNSATGAGGASAAPSAKPSGTAAPGGPRLDPFSAQVTLQKVNGKWLVSAYNYAPSG